MPYYFKKLKHSFLLFIMFILSVNGTEAKSAKSAKSCGSDSKYTRAYSQVFSLASNGFPSVEYLGLIDQDNMKITLDRIYKYNYTTALSLSLDFGKFGTYGQIIKDIINKSDILFRVNDPTKGFSFVLSIPSCWQGAYYSDNSSLDWYKGRIVLPWEDKTIGPGACYPSDHYYPCSDNQSKCCEYKFDVVKINGGIVVKGKIPLNVSDDKDYCSKMIPENAPTDNQEWYNFGFCSLICDAFNSVEVEKKTESESPCRDKIHFDGLLVPPPPGIITNFKVTDGVEEYYDGKKIRFTPEYEVVKFEEKGRTKYAIIIRSITMGANSNSSIDNKAVVELAIRYALNHLTGTDATTNVQMIVPEFNINVDDKSTQYVGKINSNCCSIEMTAVRYGFEQRSVDNYEVGCSQTDRPDIPDIGKFQYHGETSSPQTSCDQECYWKTSGNIAINDELNFLGPINGEDLVIKTRDNENNIKERMRIYANNKIDFSLNKFKVFPKITFDAAETSDLRIKLYCASGTQSANGDWLAYPWWITVDPFGTFDIMSSSAGIAGTELPSKKLSITNNGNIGIGVEKPTHRLEMIGTSYFKGDFKLEGNQKVNGIITAKEIYVKNPEEFWPDYVFASDYKLLPLRDIERFIKTNGHLPEVPSSKIVEEKGISVGEMNAILLKKIEEITLHLIELEKKNAILENQIEEMRNK
jgi:hypothetical protein